MSDKKKLKVNCGLAILVKDKNGVLDNYDTIKINCGTAIVSAEINAKLTAKGASINSGDLRVQDIRGEIIQLDKGAIIDNKTNLKDLFVIARDSILVTIEGMKKLGDAEGMIALDTLYYPESGDTACLTRISGKKKAYPDNAEIILGDKKLESLVAGYMGERKHLWVSGRITALEKKTFEIVRSRELTLGCSKFFSYEGLNEEYGSLINCTERILVPDEHEITGKINAAELPLYGKKVYVNGDFTMDEKDIPALEEIESIIVRGKACLPAAAAKIFRARGKADDYFVYEGKLVDINGFEQLTHNMLETCVKNGDKLTLRVNGCLVFDNDVTAADMECIASISYNGTVMVSADTKSSLAAKIKTGNGFMGDHGKLTELTGIKIGDVIGKNPGDAGDNGNSGDSKYNTGTYILM